MHENENASNIVYICLATVNKRRQVSILVKNVFIFGGLSFHSSQHKVLMVKNPFSFILNFIAIAKFLTARNAFV